MEKLKVIKLSERTGEYTEGQIQKAFESALDDLEPGLRYAGSFIGTNIGTIDTLAVDEDDRPVVIEFKGPGGSSPDALIQAMDYAVWCKRNFAWVEKAAAVGLKKEFVKLAADIRVIIVAPDIEERVVRSAYAVEFETKLVSFKMFEQEKETWILPIVEADTSVKTGTGRVAEVLPPKTFGEHLAGKPDSIKDLYAQFEREVKALDSDIELNPAPQDYIGVKYGGYNLFAIHPKLRWIRLDFSLNDVEAASPKYVYQESWNGGYFHLTKEDFKEGIRLVRLALEKAQRER